MAVDTQVPENIAAFLDTPTPDAWLEEATNRLPEMLLDHANCELKAASTALGFLYRYPERTPLAQRMSRLAREELRHFEQVRSIMDDMEIPFERLSASRYAGGLRAEVSDDEPSKLLDMLLDHVRTPEFQCRFRWRKKSLAFWDNRCAQHYALWDYFPEKRMGYRVTVCGDRPV